jgi:diaminopimelate epimerase
MIILDDVIICHGSLNKFIMIDETQNELNITTTKRELLSKNLSNSFNTDGVLYVQNSIEHLGKMSMFNSDGSEAEMCGNGIRCVARFLHEKYNKQEFYIETKNDKILVKNDDFIYKSIPTYSVEIAPVSLETNLLPMVTVESNFINKTIDNSITNFSAVSVQNPHIVFIKSKIVLEELIKYGEIINSNRAVFPNQVNLNFVKIVDDNSIYVVTNERGSGITKSCGTGMSSSTYVACFLEYFDFDKKINVYNDGGKVICIARKKSINLIGNATYVCSYKLMIKDDMSLESKDIICNYENEIAMYDEFVSYIKENSI